MKFTVVLSALAVLSISAFGNVVRADVGFRESGCYGCNIDMRANIADAVRSALIDLAASPDFKNATKFQNFVRMTSDIKDPRQRLRSYLAAVGVDSNDTVAVMRFLSASDRSSYLAAAQQNLELSESQSQTLMSRLSDAVAKCL